MTSIKVLFIVGGVGKLNRGKSQQATWEISKCQSRDLQSFLLTHLDASSNSMFVIKVDSAYAPPALRIS